MSLHFPELLPNKNAKVQQKVSLQQNTVILEQAIYPRPANCTSVLLVMFVSLRISGLTWLADGDTVEVTVMGDGERVECRLMEGLSHSRV